MQLRSKEFENGDSIPRRFTCQGDNVSPTLLISGVPETAKSLVLIMHDPDAPVGDFVHWLVWNIPPETEEIVHGSLPGTAVEGINNAGKNSYIGPCPPEGTHRYIFALYAVDLVFSDLDPEITNREKLLDALNSHIIMETELVGLYSKSDDNE